MKLYFVYGANEEEYDTEQYSVDDILARAFVVGNKICMSMDVCNDEENITYRVKYRTGNVYKVEDKKETYIGCIAKEIREAFGVSPLAIGE